MHPGVTDVFRRKAIIPAESHIFSRVVHKTRLFFYLCSLSLGKFDQMILSTQHMHFRHFLTKLQRVVDGFCPEYWPNTPLDCKLLKLQGTRNRFFYLIT